MRPLLQNFKPVFSDRIQWMAVLVVACFVSVLLLQSQSRASYPTYILALVMVATFGKWQDVFRLNLMRWVVVLLVWLCVSVSWSEPFEWRGAFSVWSRALLVLLFVVALAECQLRGQLQRWMDIALTLAGALAVIAALVNFFVSNPPDGRLNGMGQLDTHVVAALVYGVVLIFVLRTAHFGRSMFSRFAAVLISLTIVAAVFLSDSRNAWVSVALGVGVFILAHRTSDSRQFIATVVSMGLIAVIALGLLVSSEASRELLLPRGDSFRFTIWTATLNQILADSIVFGRGILTEDNILVGKIIFKHPHNQYLALVQQGGVVALFLYVVVIWKTAYILLDNYENKDAKLGLGILTLALSAHLLDGHELIDKVGDTWFLIWLPVGIALGLKWKPNHYS